MIRKSKNDQDQAGAQVAVPYARARDRCAVRALHPWLEAASIHHGPVFRQMRRGDKLTRPAAHRPIGRADRQAPRPGRRPPPTFLSGHSLRAGYATKAAAGIEERKIANVTRHKNLPVLCGYIRAATAFDDVGEVL